jgi:RNA polymerase sigma-70 factor (sigma-E family)
MTAYADFEGFVAARRDALLRTAYLLTGNHHDAEDLVQSALIKVVPKWARIKDRPESYVRQVLARESVNRWRTRRWREVTTDVVPDATHHDSTDRIGLLEDLRRLPPRQRAVLVLRYFDDLTEADTAAALGISVGTVKSHARDALATLRNQSLDEEPSATTSTYGPQHARDQAHSARHQRMFRVTR